jgi:NitT/TauT family transport system permease protein
VRGCRTSQITTRPDALAPRKLALEYRVVLPQIWPRPHRALRLSLGSAWLFLIASEAIAATEGLGYRIFLMRRYLAMDVILPYVLWITASGFGLDSCCGSRSRSCSRGRPTQD